MATGAAGGVLAKCDPSPPSSSTPLSYGWFDGWQYNDGNLGGVYADIYNYSPWVQSGSMVASWVMLASSNGLYWAQIGWLEDPGGYRYTFYQGRDTNGVYHQDLTILPFGVGTTQLYEVLYNNTPGKYTLYIDGTLYATLSLGFTPSSAQNYGEVHNEKDQMPGSQSTLEVFSDAHVYAGGWRNFGGSAYNEAPSWWGNDPYSTTEDWIWDNRCSS
ncbi:MAG: hypothetical protein ACYCZN_15600 [Candidatus Dormibacteria bacterium]